MAGALLVLLLASQIALPRIAAGRIRSKLGRYGRLTSVDVSAWPAVKLLWGEADTVDVRAGALAMSPARAASLLWEARGLGRIDFSAQSFAIGKLRLTQARLSKRGTQLEANGRASAAAVRAALPPGDSLKLLRSGGGEVEVEVRARGALLGLGADLAAVAAPEQGRLVVHAAGGIFGGLALTLFSDRHVHITGLAAAADGAGGYRLGVEALLR